MLINVMLTKNMQSGKGENRDESEGNKVKWGRGGNFGEIEGGLLIFSEN